MNRNLSQEEIKYIVARLIESAKDSFSIKNNDKNDLFYQGKKLAYYEVLDILKSELDAREQDIKEFGLDINLESLL